MSLLSNWNDVNALNIGDRINFANKRKYKIESKSIDRDYGGIRVILTLNTDKEVIINHLGEVSGDLGEFMLSDNKLQRVTSGGKRKSRTHRKRSKNSTYKKKGKKGNKTLRRHRKHKKN